MKKEQKLVRVATYNDVIGVLSKVCNCRKKFYKLENKYKIKVDNNKYKVFLLKGLECVCCCLKGSFLAVEKYKGTKGEIYHLNLYAIDDEGNEVLMTQDHIIPKSMTGSNHIDNLQTMCINCNGLKGDDINF